MDGGITQRSRSDAVPPLRSDDASEAPHLLAAMVGVALQPISTAAGNIGLGIAAVGLGLRLVAVRVGRGTAEGSPASRRVVDAYRHLVRQPWVAPLLLWLAWSWLTLLWSPDPAFGASDFRATRVLVWIPILWPIRHGWGPLVAAMLTGTTITAVIQAVQMATGWHVAKFGLGAGLTTPTQTGLWAAVALSFWLILAVSGGLARTLAALAPAALSGLGLVWSATRASVLALAVELVLANAVLAWTTRGWLRRAMVRAAVGLVILAGAWWLGGRTLETKIQRAVSETAQTLSGTGARQVEQRLAMWRMAMEAWPARCITGWGLGSVPSIAERTTLTHTQLDLRQVRMIHSTYLQTLVETGLIGLCLLGTFAVRLLGCALRGAVGRPLRIAGLGALVVWFTAAAFDGFQQSGGFMTVGAILIPLAAGDGEPSDPA